VLGWRFGAVVCGGMEMGLRLRFRRILGQDATVVDRHGRGPLETSLYFWHCDHEQ